MTATVDIEAIEAVMDSQPSIEAEIWQMPPTQVHLLRSKHVAQTFKIEVMEPAQKRGEQTSFPVVYVTDGNVAFDLVRGISRIIQSSPLEAPRFIVVSIGYPSENPAAWAVLRARDLTFPGFPEFTPKVPGAEGVIPPGTKAICGGVEFRNFIEDELVPFIDKTYRTDVNSRTYFGHSGGAQFGLFTLFTKSNLFNNYIISSPGLLFNGELEGRRYDQYEFLLDDARRFVAAGKTLTATKLHLSVGADEEFEPGLASLQMTSAFYRMLALLQAAALPGLTVTAEALPGETHLSSWPIAFIHGVKAVFGIGSRRFAHRIP